MGWFNSLTNGAQIIGTAGAGLTIGLVGFKASFWLAALMGVAAFALTSTIRHAYAERPARTHGVLETYKSLARMRSMYYCMACAALSVLPFQVTASFGAILLVSVGFSSGETGWLITLRAIGAIFAGVVVARFVRSAFDRRVAVWSCAIIAVSLSGLALRDDPWTIGTALFVAGISSGVVAVYFQLLVSAVSSTAQRGSAMSFGGVGWNVSNIIAPLIMGAVMDYAGIHAAFHVVGALLLVSAVGFLPFYRWAFAR